MSIMKRLLFVLLSITALSAVADGSVSTADNPQSNVGITNSSSVAYINVNTGIAKIYNLPTGSWSGSLNAGYNLNQNIALEGGYNLLASSQFGATVTSNIFDVAVKGTLPLSEAFSVYGRAGLGFGVDGWSGSASGTPSWLCDDQYNSTYGTALLGIGGSFKLSRSVDLRLEDYAFVPFSNTMSGTINTVALGAQYNF